jgi:hypothetical protein
MDQAPVAIKYIANGQPGRQSVRHGPDWAPAAQKRGTLIKSCFSSCESGKPFADCSGLAGLFQGAQASRLTTALLKEA